MKTKTLATIGTVLASTLSLGNAVAESNPFAMTEMNSGYMQVAKAEMSCGAKMKKEAACGEGKCGGMMKGKDGKKGMESACGAMMKAKEAKCGEAKCGSMMKDGKMKKGMESSCGAMMKGKEGACGMGAEKMNKMSEGKCGEGKCGGMMKNGKMKKGMESSCGAMMKGKEGTCGMGMKGKKGNQGMSGMKGKQGTCGSMKGSNANWGKKISADKAAGE